MLLLCTCSTFVRKARRESAAPSRRATRADRRVWTPPGNCRRRPSPWDSQVGAAQRARCVFWGRSKWAVRALEGPLWATKDRRSNVFGATLVAQPIARFCIATGDGAAFKQPT